MEDALGIETRVEELPALGVIARPEASLNAATDTLQRGGGDHALRCAADAVQHVDVRPPLAGGDRRGHVSVTDEAHPRARPTQLRDQLLVPVALEDDDVETSRVRRQPPARSRTGSS